MKSKTPTGQGGTTKPSGVSAAQGAAGGPGAILDIDHEFLRINSQVPGFAGLSLDSAENMTVYVTDSSQASAAINAAVASVELNGHLTPRSVQLKQVRFNFAQLSDWMTRVSASESIRRPGGLVYIDANEALNRVEAGIENEAMLQQYESATADLGIPADAVVFRVTGRTVRLATLLDRQEPVSK